MKEKLIIQNFGPIKHVELELSKFNVLIGESGTGKSTILKLISFCRYFSNVHGGYYDAATQETKNIGIDNIVENLRKHNLYDFLRDDCLVKYDCEKYTFEFSKKMWNSSSGLVQHLTSTITPKKEDFKNLLDSYSALEKNKHIPFDFYTQNVSAVLSNPFFIPTERMLQSTFSAGKDFTSNLSDSLFRYFVENDKIQKENYKNETLIEPLNIFYRNVNGIAEVKDTKSDSYFTLHNGASGFKSVIPIVLIIKYYLYAKQKRKSFLIEEPELNIHPSTQNELVKFFSESLNFHEQITVTTHSPYILSSLNNLIYAYQVSQKYNAEINKVIDEKYWINPNEVSAYLLENGEVKNIIDKETKLIDSVKIDGVSDYLSEQFNKMMAINLGVEV